MITYFIFAGILGVFIMLCIIAYILVKNQSRSVNTLKVEATENTLSKTSTEKVHDVISLKEEITEIKTVEITESNGSKPLAVFSIVEDKERYQSAREIPANNSSLTRLTALAQAIPNALIASEIAGKKIMEVVVNGSLARAKESAELFIPIVRGKDGKIIEMAKLKNAGKLNNLVNAAAVWQAVSVIVAQKHLADISDKLEDIQQGLNNISSFLAEERKSKISGTFEYLKQVYGALKGGDLPMAIRYQLESCERELMQVCEHLRMEQDRNLREKIEDNEIMGSSELPLKLKKKIDDLADISDSISFCLKTRVAVWHVLSLYPGEQTLKAARRQSIVDVAKHFLDFSQAFDRQLELEIGGIDSSWNTQATIDARRNDVRATKKSAIKIIESSHYILSDSIQQIDRNLIEYDKPESYFLEYSNGQLRGMRQAKA